jgi:hypothetical protein
LSTQVRKYFFVIANPFDGSGLIIWLLLIVY